jgi:hypothetical protein
MKRAFFINGERYEGSFDDASLIEALRFAARVGVGARMPKRHQPRPRAH